MFMDLLYAPVKDEVNDTWSKKIYIYTLPLILAIIKQYKRR